jgi:hypothetical protein
MTILIELSKYKSDLVRVQDRWDGGGTEPVGEYNETLIHVFVRGPGNKQWIWENDRCGEPI